MAASSMGPGAIVTPSYQQAEMEGEKETKLENNKHFIRSDYAYTPDGPDTWKLRLTNTPGGKPDPRIVGAAVAALGKGFRGNKVQIPSKDLGAVKARVLRAWKQANPDYKPDDVPGVLKAEADMNGVAPPGWEQTVKKMKRTKGVDNPFALAWYMHNRGMQPAKHEHDAAYDTLIAQAQRELQGHQMPTRCLNAARGDIYALNECLRADPIVLERQWW